MRSLRRHRGRLTGWLIAVLLLTQLATAAYACPQLAPPPADMADMVDMADMTAMPDCSGAMPARMDPDQPQLCKAHCESDQRSLNSQAAAPDAPPALAVGAVWVGSVDVARQARRAASMPRSVADGPPTGAPPLYISLLVLRN